ncbi:MAG: hypothetical protein AB7V27_04575 [Candidatus Binatia bacterium]
MRTVKGRRAGKLAGILMGVALVAGAAQAQQDVGTEPPASILIFPKVIRDDTVIQITNTTNSLTHAKCFYVNGDTFLGEPLWQVTDFEIMLTRQQPTHWVASQGRAVSPIGAPLGIDPGLVPPVPVGFEGFLVCVEVAMDGTPISGNSLIGVATVGGVDSTSSSIGKYNAVGIAGCGNAQGPCGDSGSANNGDNVLDLDGVEYARCPGGLYVNFESEGGVDPALGAGSEVSTNVALVPCGMDFDNIVPGSTVLSAEIRDEFEIRTSVSSIPVDCYFAQPLSAPVFGGQFSLPTTFGSAIIRPQTGSGNVPAVGVANVLRTASDLSSDSAITNLHFCTDTTAPASCTGVDSQIRLPDFE